MNLQEYQKHFYQELRSGRCSVYSGQFIGSVCESLIEIFSMSYDRLGIEAFENLANAFAHSVSFLDWSRFQIGNEFPKWVELNSELTSDVIELLCLDLAIHHAEISGEIPKINESALVSWLEGASASVQIQPDCQSLLTATGATLVGMSTRNTAHFVNLNQDELELLKSLKDSNTYLTWIASISTQSTLRQEELLANFLQKLIAPGWLICSADETDAEG